MRNLWLMLVTAVIMAACASDDPAVDGLNPGFGSNDAACSSPSLTNDEGDNDLLRAAIDCFFTEVDAGREVVIDIDAPTVEGDSSFHRYYFDGTGVLIVEDDRLDSFGRGGVSAQRCATLERTDWLPVGVRCDRANHPGFPEADG